MPAAIISGVSAAVGLGTSLFSNNSAANDDAERAQIKQLLSAGKRKVHGTTFRQRPVPSSLPENLPGE